MTTRAAAPPHVHPAAHEAPITGGKRPNETAIGPQAGRHASRIHGGSRAALGGRVQYAWSAAAPLGTRLGHFLRGCGVNVLEGYGLTETSPATNSNTLDAQRIGTVGRCGRVSSGPVRHSACDGGT